ncbi:amino acid permease [Ilyobacter polytropus]|uniref:Amino acid permease-associated region n=1 Tax=Ilyobacter polytropus (strain ATCC 51220 / DSM 2926 / LMG 16218 / CuHBu1) TaxID=572544 RepID=E3HB76_ILYPC|nr:amino acid permease [Ilyobacter polytropus]ADO82227.1 amino acid permease-associated region [Ilyobacter polytropus DSM 2926]
MNLKKELGFWEVFSIATGAMISSGIFILPGIAFEKAGPSIILSYFLGGILALSGILNVIELATAMPKAGGDYFFVMRTLGPLFGTVSGVLSWFALSLKSAFAILGIASFIDGIFYGSVTANDMFFISIFVTIFFMVLNIIGVDVAAKFEVTLVIILICVMVLYVIVGSSSVDVSRYTPFISSFEDGKIKEIFPIFKNSGMYKIVGTTSLIFVSFGGLLKATTVAEEVKDAGNNITKGMIASIMTITILYVLMLTVTVGNIDGGYLAGSLSPISDTAKRVFGPWGYYLINFAALLAFFTTANAGIMAASRYPMALSRDGLVPPIMSTVSIKFKTPVLSILFTGTFIMLSLMLPLELLAKTASAVILLAYMLTSLCVIILRESNVKNYKPIFKAPLYPWLQISCIIIFNYFMFSLGWKVLKINVLLIIISIMVYFLYGKKRTSQEYALLHLLLRITENLGLKHGLEEELRDIIHERDEVELDEFDRLIKNAKILDLKGPVTLDELFDIEARHLTSVVDKPEHELIKLFNDREREFSTAITDFTAIPHIVVDEKDLFYLMVVRCREGIRFNEKRNSVKAVFLFISSPTLRKTHLRTLASIASLTREESYERKWMSAKNENYLRDMILLSKRERIHHKF